MAEILVGSLTLSLNKNGQFLHPTEAYYIYFQNIMGLQAVFQQNFMCLVLEKDRLTKSTSMAEILVGSLTLSLNKNGQFLHQTEAYYIYF